MSTPPEPDRAVSATRPAAAPPTWATWREARAILAQPPHLRRTVAIALVVGTTPGRVALADAARVPIRPAAADAVVGAMALMVVDDPDAAVAEMARLLAPGGRLVALLPATAPLTARDRARYARLLATLRLRRLPFPHPGVLRGPQRLLTRAGLAVVSDERRRFAYPLAKLDDGLLLVRSLYLPGLSSRRQHAAQRVTRRWRLEHRDPIPPRDRHPALTDLARSAAPGASSGELAPGILDAAMERLQVLRTR